MRVTPRTSVPRLRWYLRSEEHTSELQSRLHLVCRLLLEKKKEVLSSFWQITGSPMSSHDFRLSARYRRHAPKRLSKRSSLSLAPPRCSHIPLLPLLTSPA